MPPNREEKKEEGNTNSEAKPEEKKEADSK